MSRLSKIIQNTDPPVKRGSRLNRLIQTTDGSSYDDQFFQGNRPNNAPIDSETQYLTGRENVNRTQVQGGLDTMKAQNQPWHHQVANGIARLPFNIVMGTVGQVASALDFEDYANADQEVGNWLTNAMLKGQEFMKEQLPVHRTNPTKALDLGDSGWWYDNASSLIESIASFAATGGILAKGITTLSRAVKAQKLAASMMGANNAALAGNASNTVINAVLLNQAEAILESGDVYSEIYDQLLATTGNDDLARGKASGAAAATINFNRLNILLNITSANLFFKSPQLSRRKLDNPYAGMSIARGTLEGGQESVEEIINMLAGNYGRAVGLDKPYSTREIIADIGTPEALEAALLGFAGGMGQTVLTTEGVNRLQKTTDPETGEKISVKEYNVRQYERFKEEIEELNKVAESNEVGNFTSVFKSTADIKKIRAGIDKAVETGQTEKAQELKSLLLSAQALNAFERGTTEHLIRTYEALGQGEQKADMGKDYKERAKKAVKYIKDMEKVYNQVQQYQNPTQVYYNRAQTYTAVEQYGENKSRMSKAQSDLAAVTNRMADAANIDSSSITEEFLGKKTHVEESHDKISKQIKSTPEYKEVQEAKKETKTILKELERLDKEYEKITSGIFQEQAKKDRETAHQKMKEFLEKVSEEKAAQAKREEEKKAKEATIAKQQKEADIAKKQEEKVQEQVKKDAVALEHAAVGDIVNITEAMSKQLAGKEGIVTKREKGKITITETESGHTITLDEKLEKKPEPEPTEPDEDFSTEGGDTSPITQEEANDLEEKTDKVGGAKVISTKDKSGDFFPWIMEQYPLLAEYERYPVSKKNKPVTFEINDDIEALSKLNNAEEVLAAVEAYKEGAFNDPVKRQLMIDFLPINVVFRKGSEGIEKIAGPIETYPKFAKTKKGVQNFLDHTSYLRANIVEALAQGYAPDEIVGSVQDQYKGILQIDTTPQGQPERENAIHDLHTFNGMMDKVELFMVDRNRNLVDVTGKVVRHGIGAKGEIYTVIPMANGEPFYLKLNVKRINQEEAEILYEMYKQRMIDAETGLNTAIDDLPKDLQDKINKVLGPTAEQKAMPKNKRPYLTPLELIGKGKDTTVKDITDFLIYDGTKNSKSQVRLDGAVLRFGNKATYKNRVELEKNKDAFIKFLTTSKRHHIKYRLKRNDPADSKVHAANRAYVSYLLGSKTLNTNAIVKEPTFQGRTSIYLNKGVKADEKAIGRQPDPNAPRPTKTAPTKGKAEDIDDAGKPGVVSKDQDLESSIRAEWTEAIQPIVDAIEEAKANGEDTTGLQLALDSLNSQFKMRLRATGFDDTYSEEAPKAKLEVKGTSVLVKKDANSNWSLRVAEDGKVYNENTGSEILEEKLINKAQLKSGYVTFDKVQVEKGIYAVTSDGRVINITPGGKSNGNSLSLKSSIAKKVLAKHEETAKPTIKDETKTVIDSSSIERRRQEELLKPLEKLNNAKTKEELIIAAEEWIGMNPYDDGAVSMGTRSLLMTPGNFEKGKQAFITETKKTAEIRDKQINAKYDAELKAMTGVTETKADPRVKAAIDGITEEIFSGEFEAKVQAKDNPKVVVILADANKEALITKIYEHYDAERPGNISKSGKKVVPLHEIPGTPENEMKKAAPRKKPRGEQVTDIAQTEQEKELNKEPEKECGGGPKSRSQERKDRKNRRNRK